MDDLDNNTIYSKNFRNNVLYPKKQYKFGEDYEKYKSLINSSVLIIIIILLFYLAMNQLNDDMRINRRDVISIDVYTN